MEPFQQYLTERFPKDSKRSPSSVVHKLDSTVNACGKTLTVLGKLPGVRKWIRETKLVVSCLYNYYYHSSWV